MRSAVLSRALFAACLVVACGGTDDAGLTGIPAGKAGSAGSVAMVCTFGTTQLCVGPGACKGGQSCLENGSGWTPCDCGAGSGGSAGTSASGGASGASAGTSAAGTGGSTAGAGGSDVAGAGGSGGDTTGGAGGTEAAGAGGTGTAGMGGTAGAAGAAGSGGGGPLAAWSDGFTCPGATIGFDALDPQGNVFVGGTLTGSCTFGATTLSGGTGASILVVKLDPTGLVLWAKAFGDGSSQDSLGGLAVDSAGNVALAGTMQGTLDFGKGALGVFGNRDVFVAKLASDGSPVWAQSYGNSATDTGEGVAFDVSGNVLLLGMHTGKADFGIATIDSGPSPEMFAAKLSPSGATMWVQGFYGAGTSPLGIAAKAGGHAVLAGGFRSDVSFGGGPIHVAKAPGSGRSDLFVAELDEGGQHVWSHAFGDADGNQAATVVAVTNAGGVVVTGAFDGALDFGPQKLTSPAFTSSGFAAAFAPGGAYQWGLAWGGSGVTVPGGLAIGPADSITLVGSFTGSVSFGGPTLVAGSAGATYFTRLDATGGHLKSASWNDSAGRCVTVDGAGAALVGGTYTGALDFGVGTLPIGAGSSVYVAKLTP
jgi:hypothetical protein